MHPSNRPTRTLRDEQKQYTRDRLIAAGLEVFSRTGYVRTTVEDIAAAAGASRATFYLHFSTKADIARALVIPLLTDTEELYDELERIHPPSRSAIREWLDHSVSYWEQNSNVSEVVQQVLSVEPEIASDVMAQRVSTSLEKVVEFVVKNSDRDNEEARTRGAMLFFSLERFCFFWIVRGLPGIVHRDRVIDTLADVWWEALIPRR